MRWVAFLGLAFGAIDQYLGTTHVMVHTGAWAASLSNLSALWLIVPFVAGWSQPTRGRAAGAGAVALAAAFVGYWALTLSPAEGVAPAQALRGVEPLVAGHVPWLLGGAVGAPAFGLLGYRWRAHRAWTSAAAVSLILVGEPFAWMLAGLGSRLADARPVWTAEVAAGLCTAIATLAPRLRR